MKFFKKLNIFKKDSDLSKHANEIMNTVEENTLACKNILALISNNSTNIELINNSKTSYYVFLTDKIYLSNNDKNKNNFTRIGMIAHECIHSVQSKILQWINFLSSNLEMIFFVILIILKLFNFLNLELIIIYSVISLISIITRNFLEVEATVKSVNLSKKYLSKILNDSQLNEIIDLYKFQTFVLLPGFIIYLNFGKILRFVAALVLYYLI